MAWATCGGFAACSRIVAAHDALNAGELNDSAGYQVGLAQMRRALGIGSSRLAVELRVGGQMIGQTLDAGRSFRSMVPSFSWNTTSLRRVST